MTCRPRHGRLHSAAAPNTTWRSLSNCCLVWAMGCCIVALGGCRPKDGLSAGDALQGRLVITGSSTMAPLVAEIGRRYEQQHPGVRIDVQTGGSSRGITDARRGTADIGMASRALYSDEMDLANHTIARDGVCLILHATNPVEELTDEQVVSIYTGRVTNWRQMGGPDARITVVNKAAGRSTLELFRDHFQIDVATIQAHVVIGDNQQGIKTVAGDPHSIGYVSIGSAQYEADRGVPIKLLSMGGIPATEATVRDGSFPLARPLNLVTRRAASREGRVAWLPSAIPVHRSGLASIGRDQREPERLESAAQAASLLEAFIGFATSGEVAKLVEAHSFVPISE
jgi:phosphate transport system substrate-binding protein